MKFLNFNVIHVTNTYPKFYQLLGPFFGSREVYKALGGGVFDDAGKEWLIALDGGKVAGFCAFLVTGKRAKLKSSYVIPEYRKKGLYDYLFGQRMVILEGRGIEVITGTATAMSRSTYERYGFTLRPKGNYFEGRKVVCAHGAKNPAGSRKVKE